MVRQKCVFLAIEDEKSKLICGIKKERIKYLKQWTGINCYQLEQSRAADSSEVQQGIIVHQTAQDISQKNIKK